MNNEYVPHSIALEFATVLNRIEGCKCSADTLETSDDFLGCVYECLAMYLNKNDAIKAFKQKYSYEFDRKLSNLLNESQSCIFEMLEDIKTIINEQK